MKLRTGFVTNSSSYSSAEIRIDNPVLLEILARYKAQGAFLMKNGEDHRGYVVGQSEFAAKSTEIEPCCLQEADKTPAAVAFFDSTRATVFYAPGSLEEVADCILRLIAGDFEKFLQNRPLFTACREELKARREEILSAYREVYWYACDEEQAEDEDGNGVWDFYYKKK